MKKILSILAIASASLAACQNNSGRKTANGNDSTSTNGKSSSKECYQYVLNRDTAYLSLDLEDEQVTGSLEYKLFEKDNNNGVIAGIVKGDTIIADYTFQSEGKTSTRQVALLKQGNQMIEGFGDIEEVEGKTIFKNTSKLTFDKSMVFKKTECK